MKNDEEYNVKTNTHSFSNLLSVSYAQLKAEAEEIVGELNTFIVSHTLYNFIGLYLSTFLYNFTDDTEC